MKILVTNDDGVFAPGLQCLAEHLRQIAEIVVVVPDRDRSGASNSLTLDRPLHMTRLDNGYIKVNGTPTDCVHLALCGGLDVTPDMVVSGINAGANLGDDVLYSGTVAAATEGRFLGLPAIAVSLDGHPAQHYETAAKVVLQVLGQMRQQPLPEDTILSINVPDIPYAQLKGLQAARLGQRHRSESIVKDRDPRGRDIYWVGKAGPQQDAGPGTDFYAVEQGYAAMTPLQIDLTKHSMLNPLAEWLRDVSL